MKFRRLFFVVIIFFGLNLNAQTQISPYLFGQNAWMPDSIGVNKFWGQLDNMWGFIDNANIKLIRIGGIAFDENPITNYQIIKLIDSVRSVGAEPLIQVAYDNGNYSSTQAAELVNYVNNTSSKNVLYWSISNEPVLGHDLSANQISIYLKEFASAMKQEDNTIKIVGPDLAWYNESILDKLIGGSRDVTGTDAYGNYYIDIVSFHAYPFDGGQSKADIIGITNSYLEPAITDLVSKMQNANTINNRTGSDTLRWAVTEFNVNYENPATNNESGLGANSFINGQLWAEMFGLAMEYNAEFVCPWSIHESSGSGSDYDLGFINGSDGNYNPRPSYYHEQLLATNTRDYFAKYTSNITDVKCFGNYNADSISVVILNMSNQEYNYNLYHNNTDVGAESLQINTNALELQGNYSSQISANCSQLLVFNNQGDIRRKYTYCIGDNGPSVEYFTPDNTMIQKKRMVKNDILIYPNPTKGEFNLQTVSDERIHAVSVVNSNGQLVINKSIEERNRISLNLLDKPKGIYFIRIITSKKAITSKLILE